MAKVFFDISIKLTFARILGTIIITAGLVYTFINKDAHGPYLVAIGAAMIVGRSAIDKFAGAIPMGGGRDKCKKDEKK